MKNIIILILLSLSSCAGYHFVESDNPLSQYGIKTISIPMFINYTVVPGASVPMTREISKMLSQYPGIQIIAGEDVSADAILIGTLSSSQKIADFYKTTSQTYTTGELKDSIGARKEFYIPSGTSYNMTLDLVLIKDPTSMDLKLATSYIKFLMKKHPKVIFSESIPLSTTFSRSVDSNISTDGGGVVNYTKNKGLFSKSLDSLAKSASATFREVILNAF